jgi:hypothetical protein
MPESEGAGARASAALARPSHVRAMSESCPSHVRVMSESCPHHVLRDDSELSMATSHVRPGRRAGASRSLGGPSSSHLCARARDAPRRRASHFPIPSESFRVLPSPSESCRVHPSLSESFRVLPSPSESFRVIPSPAESFSVHPRQGSVPAKQKYFRVFPSRSVTRRAAPRSPRPRPASPSDSSAATAASHQPPLLSRLSSAASHQPPSRPVSSRSGR